MNTELKVCLTPEEVFDAILDYINASSNDLPSIDKDQFIIQMRKTESVFEGINGMTIIMHPKDNK